MGFGRLSFTTETASVCIIDSIPWGGVQHQRWCRPLLYESPILRLEWAGRWRGIGSRGSSIHLGSAEVERGNSDALRHPIAVLSEKVEQYLETPNQAFISRPWTSSKKSSVSFVCIDLSLYVAEGRSTARNKRASIAGDIFDRGMRAATLAQAAIPLFLRWSKWPVILPLVWKTTPR